MIAVAEGFERIDEADFLEERAGGLRGPLVRAIAEAELDGIDAALLREFIDYCLAGKRGSRRPRSPVGCNFRSINDYIEGINPQIFDNIGTESTHCTRCEWRAGKCASLVREPDCGRGNLPIPGGADFDFHLGAGSRSGRSQYFCARHDHFDRAPALLREKGRYRFKVNSSLATESAADFRRNNSNGTFRNTQYTRSESADVE